MEDQKPKCPNHLDKEAAFYCFNHSTFACLRCVSVHIQCQVNNHFQPLEEIFETLQQDVQNEDQLLSQRLQDYSSQIQNNTDALQNLESFKAADLNAIQEFFDSIKKKAEELKLKVIQNYETSYTSILEKVATNNNAMAQTLHKETEQHAKVQKIKETLASATSTDEKRSKAVELWNELQRIKLEPVGIAKYQVIDHELELLMSREEVFSEVGNLTLLYNNIPSKVADFLEEHMENITKGGDDEADEKPVKPKEEEGETLDEKISKIDYMKEDAQIFEENFMKALEDKEEVQMKANTRLHQLRFCSNEINVFDCTTGKFESYFLYTSKNYNTPFLVFNNCCSSIHKNHLIFLFGGEDPAMNDKTSNRVFCFNLDHATADKKVVVYEISSMAYPRQEFTLATVGNSIYVISGYDSNKPKEYRVIPKCERLDIRSKSFSEIRDINYPRQTACSVNVNNTHIYVFGGQNPKYLNHFVDKIERYTLKLNDWSVVKYSVMNEFNYEPGTHAACFRLNETDIVILGGQREYEMLNGYYVFDMRKLLFVKKEEGFLEEADNFLNQNDVEVDKEGRIQLFSSTRANFIYEITVKDAASYSLAVTTTEAEDIY